MEQADSLPPAASDRRRAPRRRVLLSGKLAYADHSITADCSVRNLSESGTMIVLPPMPLPIDPFLIVIKQASLHEARTVWRAGGCWGLQFLASWRLTGDAPETMRQLWRALLPH
jgi:hypothetical protein